MDPKELHDQGWAIHWLMPQSKRPIEKGWTTGPRKTWAQLKASHQKGYNVGVRLGTPSKINGGYLAVIDVDVKSDDPKHRKEAYEAVDKLIRCKDHPRVLSGRGNGSCHIYGFTRTPTLPRRLDQSGESVRVRMPSVSKTSKREKESLTEKEIKDGIHLRPAYEISLMGTGQQVVLPPSIHPDTGKAYAWDGEWFEIPEFKGLKTSETIIGDHDTIIEDVKFKKVDVLALNLSDDLTDLILSGKGCEDRSAALFTVSMQMARAGCDNTTILSVLTDRENFLGKAAYDHAQTNKRSRASKWLQKYTLKKARYETSAAKDFANLVKVSEPLSDEQAAVQKKELIDSSPWKAKIERVSENGPPKASIKNIVLILDHTKTDHIFIHNDFSNRTSYGIDSPWGGKKGSEITDEDVINIRLWLAKKFRFEPARDKVSDSITHLAHKNSFHPVRDYLNGLKWDGTERINRWLVDYSGAQGPEPYLSEVSRKVLLAMVARIFVPGIKFDHVAVLEGTQGIGKSSIPRILAGPWYNETMPDIRDKDAMLNLQGAWVNEISELATLRKTDTESYKAFFTRQADRVRAPYGERWQEYKRQCIFIGTTNSHDYLSDKTGNRRFWPVKIRQLNFDGLIEARDQLFAESVWHWKNLGERLYLDGGTEKQAMIVQAQRVAEDEQDAMADKITAWIKDAGDENVIDVTRFKLSDLFEENGPFAGRRADNWAMQKAGRALIQLGFKKHKTNTQNYWGKSEF